MLCACVGVRCAVSRAAVSTQLLLARGASAHSLTHEQLHATQSTSFGNGDAAHFCAVLLESMQRSCAQGSPSMPCVLAEDMHGGHIDLSVCSVCDTHRQCAVLRLLPVATILACTLCNTMCLAVHLQLPSPSDGLLQSAESAPVRRLFALCASAMWRHTCHATKAVATCRVPQDSTSKQYQEYLVPRLGDTSRLVQFIFKPAQDGGNLVALAALRDAFKIQEELEAVRGRGDGKPVQLRDVCWRAADGAQPCPARWTCRALAGLAAAAIALQPMRFWFVELFATSIAQAWSAHCSLDPCTAADGACICNADHCSQGRDRHVRAMTATPLRRLQAPARATACSPSSTTPGQTLRRSRSRACQQCGRRCRSACTPMDGR